MSPVTGLSFNRGCDGAVAWLTENGSARRRRRRSPDRDADAPWPAAGPADQWKGAVSSPRRAGDAAWLAAGPAALVAASGPTRVPPPSQTPSATRRGPRVRAI